MIELRARDALRADDVLRVGEELRRGVVRVGEAVRREVGHRELAVGAAVEERRALRVHLVLRARVGAGVVVAGCAGGDAVAPGLHLPEERLAERHRGAAVDDEVGQVRRLGHGLRGERVERTAAAGRPRETREGREGERDRREEDERQRRALPRRSAPIAIGYESVVHRVLQSSALCSWQACADRVRSSPSKYLLSPQAASCSLSASAGNETTAPPVTAARSR